MIDGPIVNKYLHQSLQLCSCELGCYTYEKTTDTPATILLKLCNIS